MSRARILVLAVVWAVSLPIAWRLGYMQGNTVRISAEKAQHRAEMAYLMKIAYPVEVPTLEVIQKVRSLAERPEEVRAYLVDIQRASVNEAEKNEYELMDREVPFLKNAWVRIGQRRREILDNLRAWKPGQTESPTTQEPKP